MKKTLKKILAAMLITVMAISIFPFSAFASESIVTEKGNLEDYAVTAEISDLENVEIIDILDTESKNVILVKNAEGNYCCYSSNDGVNFVSSNLSLQIGRILGIDMNEVYDFEFTNIQEIEEKIIIHGWYSVVEQKKYEDGTDYEIAVARNFAVMSEDSQIFKKMDMPDLNLLWDKAYITECNGRYVYYPERQLPLNIGISDSSDYICQGFFYTSNDLKNWEIHKTPQYESEYDAVLSEDSARGYVYTANTSYEVGENSLVVYAYHRWPTDSSDKCLTYFGCTNDFVNYTDIDYSFINYALVQGFIVANNDTLVIFTGEVEWEWIEDYGYRVKNADVYALDMSTGNLEKIASEYSDKEIIRWILIAKAGLERTLLCTDKTNGTVYYSNDGYKTVNTLELARGDKEYFLFGVDYSWSYKDYTVGVCNNIENKLSIIKDDCSAVYGLDFESAENSFVSGGKLYIMADSRVYMVAMEELIEKLGKQDTEEPDEPVLTYTAKWIVDGQIISENEHSFGESIDIPDDPVKQGYVFTGWTPDVPYFMPESNMTFYANFNQVTAEHTVTSIRIVNEPNTLKYEYSSGAELDLIGLVIEVTYSDGVKETKTDISDVVISEFSTDEAGVQTITVEYKDCTDTFEVEVVKSVWQEVAEIFILFIELILVLLNSLGLAV